jgi:hypothetical protein
MSYQPPRFSIPTIIIAYRRYYARNYAINDPILIAYVSNRPVCSGMEVRMYINEEGFPGYSVLVGRRCAITTISSIYRLHIVGQERIPLFLSIAHRSRSTSGIDGPIGYFYEPLQEEDYGYRM